METTVVSRKISPTKTMPAHHGSFVPFPSLSLSHTSPVQFGCILAVIVLYCMYIYIVMNEDRKVRKEMAAREVEDACGGEVGGTLKQRC